MPHMAAFEDTPVGAAPHSSTESRALTVTLLWKPRWFWAVARDSLAVWYVGTFRMSRRHARHEPLPGPQHRYNNALKEKSNAAQKMDTRTRPGSVVHQT